MINKLDADHFDILIVLNGVICSLQDSSGQEKDWLAGSTRGMIRIQRMKTQCKENLHRGKAEIAQYGCEKVGSNKWSVGKERNPTGFKNRHC